MEEENIVKIVILGDGRVGKTCITLKYVKNTFDPKEESTINADFLQKKIAIGYKQQIQANIWDTAGQERFRSLAPMYYRDALGAIVVYDVSNKESFEKIQAWVQELKQNAQENEQEIQIIIAGNKYDLPSIQHQVAKQEAEELAKSLGTTHMYTSAKTGEGIKKLFETLAQKIIEVSPKLAYNASKSPSAILGETSNDKQKQQKKEKKGCC